VQTSCERTAGDAGLTPHLAEELVSSPRRPAQGAWHNCMHKHHPPYCACVLTVCGGAAAHVLSVCFKKSFAAVDSCSDGASAVVRMQWPSGCVQCSATMKRQCTQLNGARAACGVHKKCQNACSQVTCDMAPVVATFETATDRNGTNAFVCA
jgi:hypothetical protein